MIQVTYLQLVHRALNIKRHIYQGPGIKINGGYTPAEHELVNERGKDRSYPQILIKFIFKMEESLP